MWQAPQAKNTRSGRDQRRTGSCFTPGSTIYIAIDPVWYRERNDRFVDNWHIKLIADCSARLLASAPRAITGCAACGHQDLTRESSALVQALLCACAINGVKHCSDGSARFEAALTDQRPPSGEAQCQPQNRALICVELRAEYVLICGHDRPE